MNRKIKKRGQEEIVGFVLIMVIVAVVFLIFLGITLRKGGVSKRESSEVYQFLESSMEYTSDCAIRFVPDYSTMGELFEECYGGMRCIDERDACEVLEQEMRSLLDSSWNVGPDGLVKGYEFISSYENEETSEQILSIQTGNCNNTIKGASYLIPAFPGKIQNTLSVCY